MTDAVDQTMSQFTEVLIITVAIAMIMALLIAYNAAAINAEERTRETATMFAYGITRRVIAGNIVEALLIGPARRSSASPPATRSCAGSSTCPCADDARSRHPVSISAATFALAALAGIVSVALAPLFTLGRLRRTDIPSALRVVE